MALVYLRKGVNESGYIINTKNIETFLILNYMDNLVFRVYLMNGENYDFNQIFNGDNFVDVYDMYQLYAILSKIERGVIQDGSS